MRSASPRRAATLFVLSLTLSFSPLVTQAGWDAGGASISTGAGHQTGSRIVSDGSGGAIIGFIDNRNGFYMVYAQRVDVNGVVQWATNGVLVSSAGADNTFVTLISDGAGGAILTWMRSNDIYAQRINGAGAAQWTAGGVAVCTAVNTQQGPYITTDSANGAIIVWQDLRNGVDYDLYAQRINSSGTPAWTANGVAIVAATGLQADQAITSDPVGGALIAWYDNRGGAGADIYAQRINSAGAAQWTANGVVMCTASSSQYRPSIVSDGSGGAYVAWEDFRTALEWDTYIRRINSAGTPQWAVNGIGLSTTTGSQYYATLMPDGNGGVFVSWDDSRSGVFEIYTQRMNASGTALWATNGVGAGSNGSLEKPAMVSDGQGGILLGWTDQRSTTRDIYARRINSSGVAQWAAGGVLVSDRPASQQYPDAISDGAGGLLICFDELSFSNNTDVYAQRIERNGYWGYPAPNIAKVRDVPGDQGGQVNVSWDASRLDPWPNELIDTYTVWRSLSPSAAAAALAAGAETWRERPGAAGMQGAIRTQRINQTTYFWQLIHTVNAYGLNGYSDLVPTPFDSTATSNAALAFQVIAHAAVGQWISQSATGRSIDNIAPSAPLQLSAQRVGADVHLIWSKNHEFDLDKYRVYRKASAGVTAIPTNFLSDAIDTVIVDAAAPPSGLYYIVTAVDTHDNQSAKSNEASVSPVTGVNDTPRSYTLSVSNYPNPFNPRTTVSYTVPSRGVVDVSVYDASGAHVVTLFHGDRNMGAYSVEWDGRTKDDAVASGVYFARITHGGETRTQKMVLLK